MADEQQLSVRRRPALRILVVVVFALYTLALAVGTVWCFYIARSPKSSARGLNALVLGGIVLAIMTIIYGACVASLWRSRRWGWWVLLVINSVMSLLILWDMFIDHDRDPDNWSALAFFAIAVILLVLPRVRPRVSPGAVTGPTL